MHALAKEKMTQQNQQIAVANDAADGLANCGASPDGAEFAEQVAKEVDKMRKHIHAAMWHAALSP